MMKNNFILRVTKRAMLAAAVLFIGVQVVRPAKTNPAVDQAHTLETQAQVTPEVAALLKRACNDCHSNETKWPWYSNVAPVSWFVIDHVNHGRRHLNFSDWARYDGDDADALLSEISKTVKGGSMPLDSYTALHPEARITQEDRRMIAEWAQSERARMAHRHR